MQTEFERRINFFRENPVTDWHEHLTFGEITYEQSSEYAKRITADMKLCGLENYPNVYVDIAGSVLDSDVVESLVAHIGANRILYGSAL